MPGCGTRAFLDPDQYEASLRQAQIELNVTPRAAFKARFTWAELHHLYLLRCEEDAPSIVYLSLAAELAFVAFPVGPGPTPVWRGTKLQAGDIMLHSRGERLHRSTAGPSVWSVIALDPAQLESYARALSGKPFSPRSGQILRPSPRDAARLRRLHTQACRLAETRSKVLTHPEVARAIEQSLIQALVTCVMSGKVEREEAANQHRARIMVKFEEVLAEHMPRPLRASELCELTGVTDRTLRSCCAEFIGVSPSQYSLLRRLKLVRIALRDADADQASVAELALKCGFTELGRFNAMYQAVFCETPSTTLRHRAEPRLAGP
jgi:AraC-like DNA-binding protein